MIMLLIMALMSTVVPNLADSTGLYRSCNTWSAWTNNNKPDVINTSDNEHLTRSEITAFCPPDEGGVVTRITCRDNKGEAFTSGNYTQLCSIMCGKLIVDTNGAVCNIFNGTRGPCPDYFVRFFCECPVNVSGYLIFVLTKNDTISTTTQTTTATTTQLSTLADITLKPSTPAEATSKANFQSSIESTSFKQKSIVNSNVQTSTTNEGNGLKSTPSSKRTNNGKQRSYQSDQTFTIGGTTISLCFITTLICALLFIINIILTACLYKRAVLKNNKRLSPNGSSVSNYRKRAAVSPVNAV